MKTWHYLLLFLQLNAFWLGVELLLPKACSDIVQCIQLHCMHVYVAFLSMSATRGRYATVVVQTKQKFTTLCTMQRARG